MIQRILQILNKYFNFIVYYLLIVIGLIATSWIIWARFIRTRTIRDIPDALLTEYRFWILLYICCIYLFSSTYLVIALIRTKQKKQNYIITTLVDIIYKPFIALDHLIKYNSFMKNKYRNFMYKRITSLKKLTLDQFISIILFCQIIPRMILIIFLFVDTFYFHKLEIFYKVVLIGMIPFIFRYIKHSFKDLKTYLIEELSLIYEEITMFDLAYSDPTIEWERTEDNEYHNRDITIKEFVEFKTKQIIYGKPSTNYLAEPLAFEEIYISYRKINNKIDIDLNEEDSQNIKKQYNETMPKILDYSTVVEMLSIAMNKRTITWCRIVIFTGYLICWSYILIISYKHFPVDFQLTKYFLNNFKEYLSNENNPFIEVFSRSKNVNVITPEDLKKLLKTIIQNIKNSFI